MCIYITIKRKQKYNEINNNSNKAKQNGKKSFKYNKNQNTILYSPFLENFGFVVSCSVSYSYMSKLWGSHNRASPLEFATRNQKNIYAIYNTARQTRVVEADTQTFSMYHSLCLSNI